MDIHIKNVTNYESIKDFVRFSMFKGKSYKANIKFYLVIMPLFNLLTLLLTLFNHDYYPLFIILFVSTSTLALMYLLMPKYIYKNSPIARDTEDEYIFKEKGVTVIQKSKVASSDSYMDYSALYKIYETDKYMYFYLSANSSLILKKSNITEQELNIIRDRILSQVSPKKYIKCK